VQARLGRDAKNYNYGRAKIITGRVSINGRNWQRKLHCDYIDCAVEDAQKTMQVGQVRDFVVVSYTNKNIERLRGRAPQARLQGDFMFARLRQYHPTPEREENMWVAPRKPSYRVDKAIPVQDLCSYLHRADERSGREGYVNLVTVAVSFVNA
jgi:hypothetical protein